ncbi:MAG: Ig-like domain-containing protein, partial [Verrucomicrobiota bacterium]
MTPHAGATVYVGRLGGDGRMQEVQAAVTTDADGRWLATGLPAGLRDLAAVSRDGQRLGTRRDVGVTGGQTNSALVALPGLATVTGRVLTPAGLPVAHALVAGGLGTVRTDPTGRFVLADVPTGRRTLAAGVEKTPEGEEPRSSPAFSFARQGNVTLEVLPGVLNVADIPLIPAGVVEGRVFNLNGRAVPGIRVAKPVLGGFLYVTADDNGFYRFEGIEVGQHTFSAPSPPVEESEVSGILDSLRGNPSVAQINAAIQEAAAIFAGARDPLLNGEGAAFSPTDWGWVNAEIRADGDVANADLRFMPRGSVGGVTLNGQGVPVGARVLVTGIAPSNNGSPAIRRIREFNSDPATGRFEVAQAIRFGGVTGLAVPGQPTPGTFGVQAATPFSPVVISTGGFLSPLAPSKPDLVLQFPAAQETLGQISGRVLNPDGSPAAAGVQILIPFDGVIRTDPVAGFRPEDIPNPVTQEVGARISGEIRAEPPEFPPTVRLPAVGANGAIGRNYPVMAFDRTTGLAGLSSVLVLPGQTNRVSIRLLGRGDLRVRVVQADGSPVAGADVTVDGPAFPYGRFTGRTDAGGAVELQGLVENPYSVLARFNLAGTELTSRAGVTVIRDGSASVEVRLQATATVAGRFVRRDRTTPIAAAQVRAGNAGFAPTDANGDFVITGLPLGTYRVASSDPVTGVGAVLSVTLTRNHEVREVLLVEQSLGEIRGRVIRSDRTGGAPALPVELTVLDGLTPRRTVTTGPSGEYVFTGVPAGEFELTVSDPGAGTNGRARAVLPENVAGVVVDLELDPRATVPVRIRMPDGTPAALAQVQLGRFSLMADAEGRARFTGMPLGEALLSARAVDRPNSQNVGSRPVSIRVPGELPEEVLTLAGVGEVNGVVFQGDGVTPVPAGTMVNLASLGSLNAGVMENAATDADGRFRFTGVGVGAVRLTVVSGTLGATAEATVPSAGAVAEVSLVLAPSGFVEGRVLRAAGTPARETEVVLRFGNRGGTTDRLITTTDRDGLFAFATVPLGTNLLLEARATTFSGIASRRLDLTANGATNQVGDVVLDEDPPRVVSVTPADGTDGVGIRSVVEVLFSEAIDPGILTDPAVFLRQGDLPVAVDLVLTARDGEAERRLLRLVPREPLRSLTPYTLLVLPEFVDGPSLRRFGPRDRVGRLLAAPFLAQFTTADNDPPRVVSVFPQAGEQNVALGSLDRPLTPRVVFHEPIRPGLEVTLTGPAGPVPGAGRLLLDGLAVVFESVRLLEPNSTYTLTMAQVADLAGNPLPNQPLRVTFSTVDTEGPALASLALGPGARPVAGNRVSVEATLVTPEPDVTVRFTVGAQVMGTSSLPPFRTSLLLPDGPEVVIRATAIDR